MCPESTVFDAVAGQNTPLRRVPSSDDSVTLVEWVAEAYQIAFMEQLQHPTACSHGKAQNAGIRAAILAVADALLDCDTLDECWTAAYWLREQVGP